MLTACRGQADRAGRGPPRGPVGQLYAANVGGLWLPLPGQCRIQADRGEAVPETCYLGGGVLKFIPCVGAADLFG